MDAVYVSREKLCLRATVDYWVNAIPFFFINKSFDPRLCQVLEHEIVPRLEQDSPSLVNQEALDANPMLHRFTLIFDREGYSPDLIVRMKKNGLHALPTINTPKKIGH